MNKLPSLAASIALAATFAWAGGDHHRAADQPGPDNAELRVAQAGQTTMTEGEVRKVDKENKKVTLKHGEIKNLGMPGMTMVFQVKDPAMLDKVQAGDKVRFTAEKSNGGFVVTDLQPAR